MAGNDIMKWVVTIILTIAFICFHAFGLDSIAVDAIYGTIMGVMFGFPAAAKMLTKLQGK